jgi:N-acetylneuraminate synthase
MSTFVIAEAGVNHNGDLELARRLVDVAAEAGADAVKFQTFRATQLVSRDAPKAEYQTRTTDGGESQFEMIRKLELSEAHHDALIEHARTRRIEFLSTPFDPVSLDLLTRRFGLRTIKVPSGELTNGPFLLQIARAASKVIVSTGMSTLGEIEEALGVLAFGFTTDANTPVRHGSFQNAFASAEGQQALRERVTVLHCTTEYPAPLHEVNLRAMQTMATVFGLPTGYSDHTMGIHVSVAAVALGARVIEKHFTLDRNLPGPDHQASLEPDELRDLISQIRDVERALGDGIKRPTASEFKNRDVARKSLVAAEPIAQGATYSVQNLTAKRPGTGVSPMRMWDYIGSQAPRALKSDELIP